MQRLGMLAPRDISAALRRDMQRFMDRFVGRPLQELSARETGEELLALAQRHHLRMPAPLALLLKTIVMMEGIGLQLDPQLDVFAIARPYAMRALEGLASPEAAARKAIDQVQELSAIASALPHQVSQVLQQLGDGDLRVQTRDLEARRVAAALALAGTRIALALTLAAFVLALGMLGIAVGVGGWSGLLPLLLAISGAFAVIITGLALFASIVRRGPE
jgi:ubiquinone biosynthesis protein